MPLKSLAPTARSLRIGVIVAGLSGLVTALMAWQMIGHRRQDGEEDLARRSGVLLHRMVPSVEEALAEDDEGLAVALGNRLEGTGRLLGCAVYREAGRPAAAGRGMAEVAEALAPHVEKAFATGAEVGVFDRGGEAARHFLVLPLRDGKGGVRAVLAVAHDASYLDERTLRAVLGATFWILPVTLGVLVGTVAVTWILYEGPLLRLAQWMKRLRMGGTGDAPPPEVPVRLLSEESEHLAASLRAARSDTLSRSLESTRRDAVWTRERLASHAVTCLAGDPLIVASNREPYMHVLREGRPEAIVPASGLVTALDPVLRACGGLWVAHGAGEGDRQVCDSSGRIAVPPGDSRYTLKRVWLSREEEQGYYYGFSNEGLWPLCHLTHERPVFRAGDWKAYQKANRLFADAILAEVGRGSALVWVNDYHLALVPRILREANPSLRIGVFWHIPWPHPQAFAICPWGPRILHGLLGADVVGFHLHQHCRNFIDSVDRMVEARLDRDRSAVDLAGHRTLVRPFPISVQGWKEKGVPSGAALEAWREDLREIHGLRGVRVLVGVDRIDYTKGLPERFRAMARLLERHPEHRGRVTLVQLGAPSRTRIRRYRDLVTELESLAEEINWRFREDGWKPIRFLVGHHDAAAVHAFLTLGDGCVVSPLHDGMNLVAKEYVAAREDGDGVLVLSEFAGAAHELADALHVNPYDEDSFADVLHAALVMPEGERRSRMERLRRVVEERNVYRWAGSFLSEVVRGRAPVAAAAAPSDAPG